MPFGKVSEADMGDVLKLAGHLEEAHSDSIFHMCRQNRLLEVKGMLEGACPYVSCDSVCFAIAIVLRFRSCH